jgi:hypothetical protein
MNLFTVLEVAIGLIFVWFLLSMLVSTVQEAISNVFQWRGKGLEAAVRGLLDDPGIQKKLQIPLGDKFYDHPLIRSLSIDISKHRPSYIPTGQFAEVVLDLIVQAGTDESPLKKAADRAEKRIDDLEEKISQAARKEFDALIEAVQATAEAKSFNEAAIKSIDEQSQALVEKFPQLEPAVLELKSALTFPPLVTQLGAGIEALAESSPQLKQTMDILVNRAIQNTRDADQALAKARQNIENWFDNSMQRLSGTYKRRVQMVAFTIGILVALILDVDSLSIAKTLWFDQSVRSMIVSQAQTATQTGPQGTGQQGVGQIIDQLDALQIPIGWTVINQGEAVCTSYLGFRATRCVYPGGLTDTANKLFKPSAALSLLGILITGIAAAQGAPFWFDILSKLVNMKASTVPAKSSGAK